MNPIATQQVALDNSLVAHEKRLKIEKRNARIAFSKPQREETYQVTLDALKLSPCYPDFLVTTEVLEKKVDYVALLWEDFMYQAGNREISSTRKEHMSYPRFTKVIFSHIISKDKTISMRNRINLHIIRDDSLLDDMINQDIRDSKAYKPYYDFATGKVPPKKARKYKKVSLPSRKLSPVLEKEPAEKPKKAKKPTKKSTIVPTTGVVIRDTPGVPVSKKKAPSKGDRGKGMELLSDATLLKATQVKEALQKSKKDSHMLHASGSGDRVCSQQKVVDESQDKTTGTNKGTSTKLGVPNVPKYLSESENESWGDSEEEDVRTPDSFEFNDDEEEYDELYKDVDVKLLDAESEKERKGDAKMTDADESNSQEKSYEQVIEDAHVTLPSLQKTEGS
ncbi:hypothetical protein Tco_1415773 [Tanacetum coccineum]